MTTPPTVPVPGAAVAKATSAWGQAAIAGRSGYDPLLFYCRATDDRGHGEKLSFKVPPNVFYQMHELVGSKEFPDYRTIYDVARDAVIHLMQLRSGQVADPALRERIQGLAHRLEWLEYMAQTKVAIEAWRAAEEELRESLVKLAQDGAWAHVWELLNRTEKFVDPIAEPYRTNVLNVIKEWRDRVPKEHRLD